MTTTVASRNESTAFLSPQHHRQCCEQRGLNPDWIKASWGKTSEAVTRYNLG